MHPVKYLWAARALLYKLKLGKVGNMSYIGKPCFIEGSRNIYIGKRVRIFPGIRMEAIGEGKIEIGNNVALEQNISIVSMDDDLILEEDVTIGPNVYISNCDHMYKEFNKSVMDQGYIKKRTMIKEGCFVGFGSIILAGTVLGKHCIVGSNSVVRGEFPDGCVIVGNPARIIKRYDANTNSWEKYI